MPPSCTPEDVGTEYNEGMTGKIGESVVVRYSQRRKLREALRNDVVPCDCSSSFGRAHEIYVLLLFQKRAGRKSRIVCLVVLSERERTLKFE
jgi:hypothetical protein